MMANFDINVYITVREKLFHPCKIDRAPYQTPRRIYDIASLEQNHTKSRDDSQTMWQKQSEHIGQWGGICRVVPIVKC